jgi:alcohol dehydrogenase (cytochrome c)/methanol dehydrogenase (cytochrome c) subunit 1
MTDARRTLIGSVLTVALALWSTTAGAQAGNEWGMYGADYANTRYSALDQITTKNVGKLRVAWLRSLGSLESQEATPIVVGDTCMSAPRPVRSTSSR